MVLGGGAVSYERGNPVAWCFGGYKPESLLVLKSPRQKIWEAETDRKSETKARDEDATGQSCDTESLGGVPDLNVAKWKRKRAKLKVSR